MALSLLSHCPVKYLRIYKVNQYYGTWVCPILLLLLLSFSYSFFLNHSLLYLVEPLPLPLCPRGSSGSIQSPPPLSPSPSPQHHFRNSSWACSSEDDPPSPTRTSRACSSGARPRTGIVYPLQPRQRRPDTHITVEAAALPEPAALQQEEPLLSREVPTDLTRPAQRPGRKRRRKRSSALYRPAKRSPPRGRWCIL